MSFDAPNIAIESPDAFPEGAIVFNPTIDQINAVADSLDFPIASFGGADPLDAAFINLVSVRRNLSLSIVRGIDFDVNYTRSLDNGNYSIGLDGTYLTDFQQQAVETTPLVERVDTLFNPVDLKLRCRVGYTHNGLSANVFVNYINSYRVDSLPGAAPIDSWATVDLNISYDIQNRFGGAALNNTLLRVSVFNLFDQNPPSTPGAPILGIFGYDAANASPLHRFVSFEVTKRF